MAAVSWDDLDPHRYERMVGCLLSDLHQAHRVDGSGGDGGRDVYVQTATGLHIYECKSFTGRIGRDKGRRKQVERSLARATKHAPATWTLVVPIIPTPSEEAWFTTLSEHVDFELRWYGEDWLDREVAIRPWLQHYFVEGGADKAVRLLRELREEQAALGGGAPDALERIKRIVTQLDGLDPFYTYRVSVDHTGWEVGLSPRYPGAEEDRPITFSFAIAGNDADETIAARERLRRAIEYGEPAELDEGVVHNVVLDLPANLGGTFETGTVSIGPVDEEIALRASLAVVTPANQVLAAVPIAFNTRRQGTRGLTLLGGDQSGVLQVRAVVDAAAQTMVPHISFEMHHSVVPTETLPAVRVAAALNSPNRLRMTLPEGGGVVEFDLPSRPQVPNQLLSLIEAVCRIQQALGIFFEMPSEVTRRDLEHIRTADLLLAGETVEIKIPSATATLTVHDAAATTVHLLGASPGLTIEVDDFPVRIFGVDLDLRPLSLTFDSAIVVGGAELVVSGAVKDGASFDVTLIPEDGTATHLRRG